MARKHKLESDPELALDHPADATLKVLSLAEHTRLGTVGYVWPRFWTFHYETAEHAYEALLSTQEELADVALTAGNTRDLVDMEYLKKVYRCGVEMILNVVLTIQHLCEELERYLQVSPVDSTLPERLAAAAGAAGLQRPSTTRGYEKFTEIIQIRDAIEHPKASNVYDAGATTWDRVPLSWLLSDKGVATYAGYRDWFLEFARSWEAVRTDLEERTGPATLTIDRGIRSKMPARKPRTKS